MSQEDVIEDIRQIMLHSMQLPHVDNFHPSARLNQDLYLDSVLFLQLLLSLELEKGYSIPDEALSGEAFESVASLADLLLSLQQESAHD
jgi:acyl carrier protein